MERVEGVGDSAEGMNVCWYKRSFVYCSFHHLPERL
jgi:hypothetical protein